MRGRIHRLGAESEEVVEQHPAGIDVDMFGFADRIDVLKQGETIDTHLKAALGHEAVKPKHEKA